MGTRERRERELATRQAAIVAAARELAEQEGWDAVTTRRLAERIEYSQPVLYSHFAGRDEIVAAVALQGFAELAHDLRARAGAAARRPDALEAVLVGYLTFAQEHPATYHAMFVAPLDLPFASQDAPTELHDAFAALRDPVAAVNGLVGDDADLRTELVWSTLHGLATLQAGLRIPLRLQTRRIELLLRCLDSAALPTASS